MPTYVKKDDVFYCRYFTDRKGIFGLMPKYQLSTAVF